MSHGADILLEERGLIDFGSGSVAVLIPVILPVQSIRIFSRSSLKS